MHLHFTFVSLFRELVNRSAKRLEESSLLFLLPPKGHALSSADDKLCIWHCFIQAWCKDISLGLALLPTGGRGNLLILMSTGLSLWHRLQRSHLAVGKQLLGDMLLVDYTTHHFCISSSPFLSIHRMQSSIWLKYHGLFALHKEMHCWWVWVDLENRVWPD